MDDGSWEEIKRQARAIYGGLSQVLVFLAFCFYLLACVVSGAPIGPKAFVTFSYHCFQYRAVPEVVAAASVPKR
jgi:hypothetical protein